MNNNNRRVTTEEFRKEILRRISKGGDDKVRIRAGDVTRDLDAQNGTPCCCGAMKSLFRHGDKIEELPAERRIGKGDTFSAQTNGQNYSGANLVVSYERNTGRTK